MGLVAKSTWVSVGCEIDMGPVVARLVWVVLVVGMGGAGFAY